jgi:hypothetical protein
MVRCFPEERNRPTGLIVNDDDDDDDDEFIFSNKLP